MKRSVSVHQPYHIKKTYHWVWGITCGGTPILCRTIKMIITANSAPMTLGLNHLGRYPPGQPRKVINQVVRPFKINALGHTRVFPYRAGQPSSRVKFQNLCPPRDANYVMVCLSWRCTLARTSSDHDVVLLSWAFWVQGDLIPFITGVGSAQQRLQAAVLALLVL